MKTKLLNLIIKVLHWLIVKKGTHLEPKHLYKAGWVVEVVGNRQFFVEPNVKPRDKIWVEFENHYYRVYHSETRTFISLETKLEWLRVYLFLNDYYLELKTRQF